MVVLPGGKLGLNISAGVQPIPATSTSSVFSIPLAEPTLSQQPGRKFGVKLPPDNPVTSATQSTLVASPNKFAVGQNLLLFTTQQSLSDHHPNIPGVPDKPFSSQAQRSGPGAAEINASKTSESVPAATPSTSSNVPTVLDKGKGNIKPTLFDKTQSVEEENTDVAVRGEPEGESKQPATIKPISQRQVRLKHNRIQHSYSFFYFVSFFLIFYYYFIF